MLKSEQFSVGQPETEVDLLSVEVERHEGLTVLEEPQDVRDLQINGRSVGEGGMNAALAAWYGVPCPRRIG